MITRLEGFSMPSEAHQFRSLRLWSMVKKSISQPDLTEVAGATNMWRRKKCRIKQGWTCRKSAEDAFECTSFMIWKGWNLAGGPLFCVCVFFYTCVWRKEGNDWPCLHTHTHCEKDTMAHWSGKFPLFGSRFIFEHPNFRLPIFSKTGTSHHQLWDRESLLHLWQM